MSYKNTQHFVGGVCVKGLQHERDELPCQDAFASEIQNNTIALALSDGAGSARHSDIASATYVKEVSKALLLLDANRCLDGIREILVEAVESSKDQLRGQLNCCDRDLAATLLGVVQWGQKCIMFHIGDGAGIFWGNENQEFISWPENGDYVNETFFVTMEDWTSHLRVTEIPFVPTSIFLMSDGVTPFAVSKTGVAEGFLHPILQFLSSSSSQDQELVIKNLLSSDDASKISTDDKTLVWAIMRHD